MTADPLSGTALAWNVIGLPMGVSDGTDTARRVYAADGTLLAVYSGSTGTEGRVRIGSFDILSSSTGALSLESAAWEGGRLLPGTGYDKILYHITDHLGSVRVVKDGTGAVLQRFDYYPFGSVSGSWSSGTNPSQPTLRYRFGGKEIAGQNVDAGLAAGALAGTPAAAAGSPYLDFGARLYNPRSAAWLSQDPLAEKYYHISPYAYCAGNPVNLVDLEGNSPQLVIAGIGALTGGVIAGGVAYFEGKRGRDFWGAVGGGAVTGAIVGATGGMSLFGESAIAGMLQETVAGAVGGAIGSIADQFIVDQTVDMEKVAFDTATGAAAGTVTSGLKIGINKAANRVITSIEEKYASQKTVDAVSNEVKNELKKEGRSTGYRNRALIEKRTSSRINTMKSAEEYLVNKTVDAVDKAQKQVNNWWINELGTNLYEQYKNGY